MHKAPTFTSRGFVRKRKKGCILTHLQRIGTGHVKTASGYVSENARYRVVRREGCPLRCRCFKAKGNRTIELNHRLRKYRQNAKELLAIVGLTLYQPKLICRKTHGIVAHDHYWIRYADDPSDLSYASLMQEMSKAVKAVPSATPSQRHIG